MVTLKLAGEDSTTRTLPPARSTSQASSVACGEHVVGDVERARAATAARNACGVWIAHRRERSCVRTTSPSGPASLTVSVNARGGDRGVGARQRGQRAREELRRRERARGVVDGDGLDVAGRGERVAHRLRARGAALDEHEAEREVVRRAGQRLLGRGAVPGRDGDDRARHAGGGERVERPCDHRAPGQDDERLRPPGAEPLAAAGRDDERGAAAGELLRRTNRGPHDRGSCVEAGSPAQPAAASFSRVRTWSR